jgi:hypothetical protein
MLGMLKAVVGGLTKTIYRAIQGYDKIMAMLKAIWLLHKHILIGIELSIDKSCCNVSLDSKQAQLYRRTIDI